MFEPVAIAARVVAGQYEFRKHATDQVILRQIEVADIEKCLRDCVVIEAYPSDKYGPSCLVAGRTRDGRWLHVVCSTPFRNPLKIITVYFPSASDWIDYATRRK